MEVIHSRRAGLDVHKDTRLDAILGFGVTGATAIMSTVTDPHV